MSVFKCIIKYFKKHFYLLIITILAIIVVTALSLVPPQLLRIIVDFVIPQEDSSKLLEFAFLFVLTYVVIGVVNFFKEILLVIISQGIGKKTKLEMLKKVHNITYQNFSKYDTGILEAYFSNDVSEINTLVTSGVVSMLIDSFKMIGIVVSIFCFSYIFGIITLILVPIITLFTFWIKKRMYKAQASNRKLEGNVNNLVLESLDNIVTIKSFRIYDKMDRKYQVVLNGHFKANQSANFYDALFSPTMQILKTIFIVLIISLSSSNLGLFGMSVGMLVGSIDLISNLFSPIENLGMELQTIQKSMASVKRINDFFKMEEDQAKSISPDIDLNELTLEFINVSFSYDGRTKVLHNFNYSLHNHERLVLKGCSGSGKSTIFKLAYGLIKPDEGRVTIGGVDTYLLSSDVKRKLFGIVYQDYFFCGGSIKDEITLLNKEIDDEKVYKVLKMVGLERIEDIHCPLIESDYSTGELSLFNIARAIVYDSKVLFLDEMNAKIDSVTAMKIIEVINRVAKDKMVLSISHYGNLLNCSKLLVLD